MQRGSHTSRTQLITLLAAIVAVLMFASTAAADKEHVNLTALGQAAAKADVLARPDLGTSTGWTGGAKKSDQSSSSPCTSYHPKQSDLVLIGTAESNWKNAGIDFDSQADVLKTPGMVQLDWQRSVVSPEVLPCLRAGFAKEVPASEKFVSLGQVAFPKIAPYVHKYRLVLEVKNVPVMIDIVLVGTGQTEITLSTTARLSEDQAVSAAEVRLAVVLLARAVESPTGVA